METRKRKRPLLAIVGIAALVAGLLLFLNRNTEPSYQGRKLSEWIAIYGQIPGEKEATSADRDEAGRAILALGTNALPYLVDWISYEPELWRTQLGRIAERLPNGLTGGDPFERLTKLSPGGKRALAAMQAFRAIGPIAEPLLPELAQMLQRTNSPNANRRALFAISSVGPAAVPIMTNALVQPQFAGTPWAMHCTMNMGTNARPLSPIFASQLTHTTDHWIAEAVAYSFVTVGPTNYLDADLLVPLLTKFLQDPEPSVRRRALFPLKTFGAAAAAALPALTNTLNDPDPEIRAGARDAIKAISGVATQ